MGGEITLQNALERIESRVRDRADGLADLKHILRNTRAFESLSNDASHRVYETLFGVTVNEQSTYLKAKTPTTRSAAEKRLSLCASTLRLAVDSGVRYIRMNTVRSVVDHIIETLRLSTGAFCEPVALDYAKCLRSLISYQPHAEHLKKDDRERIAAFCVECIQTAEHDLADDDATSGAEGLSTISTTKGLSYRSSRSNFKDSGDSQGSRSLAKKIAEEMVTCLSVLTGVPNAAPGRNASDLLSTLIGVLQNSTIGGSSHQDAFAAINHVLAWVRTEDIELTRQKTSALVRLIRIYWSTRSSKDVALSTLRDELLICWIYLRPYILSVMHGDGDLSLRSELLGVLEVMRNEYGKRDERTQLHMDDLRLEFSDSLPNPQKIRTGIFSLQCGKPRAESNWNTLYMLATLCNVLGGDLAEENPSGDEDEENGPRKRLRLTDEFDDTLISSTSGSDDMRIGALQTLTFIAQQRQFSIQLLTKAIDKLCTSCADDNATISSWAMLALASFASQSNSSAPSLSNRWNSIWQIAVRAMSNISTCRAACHLICVLFKARLIPQQIVSDLVQTMTSSVDLNGPSVFADSVAHLLMHVVKMSQQTSPASSVATAESALSWTFRNFWPSKFVDRIYASQHVLFEPRDVIELVSCCLGQSGHNTHMEEFLICGPVSQVWLECAQQQELIEYLLLLPEYPAFIHEEVRPNQQTSAIFSQSRTGCEALVLNHLSSEMYRAQQEWIQLLQDNPRGISPDVFTSFCKFCLVATCIAFCNSFRDSRRQTQLQKQMNEILQSLANFVPSENCMQDKIDKMLTTFSSACNGFSLTSARLEAPKCENAICRTIARGMATRRDHLELNRMDEDEDEMELDGAFDSQDSRRGSQVATTYDVKSEYMARFGTIALRASMTTYANVIRAQDNSGVSTEESVPTPSAQIIDYILALPETYMLLSSNVISTLSYLGVDIDNNDCYRLLDHCAERIFRSYLYQRSEVALGAILDIMSSLAPNLTNGSNEMLHSLGLDMYGWYTSVALQGGALSPGVQRRVATLLLQLCHVDTDYGRDDESDVHSVRTSLFELVEFGTITVQHFLANRISNIFGLFVLSNHSTMFDDLEKSLPKDTDWIEGMAMRLLFLSKLASAWHSLLRQCIYYIFDAAGRVKNTTEYAERGVNELANGLNFETPRKVFNLFAPQLLHSWLENEQVTSLPFAIFQYKSLQELIEQNQVEIAAQLLVRADDKGMKVVTRLLNTTEVDLITRCFAKCQAYCICWDIAASAVSGGSTATCESRLRNVIGSKEDYKKLGLTQFAAVMGYFYLSLEQEDVFDKWLGKRQNYTLAAKALEEMKGFSHSERILPFSQQPCFKSKYLCDQVERLCRRTGYIPAEPWNSSTFAVAVRMLLDSIEDALGPLHTCLVIRKLRLLICMGGKDALSDFPLEMILHTLRPFLADSQCADDVMGILQYLFYHGQRYLQANVPFLYGTTTLMILQMRKHSGATLDSTTQESQHKSTVLKMESFQTWLVNYLRKCLPSDGSRESQMYARIANALQNVILPGNARKGSSESSLLLLLLEDNISRKQILTEPDRKEALTLLADKFVQPTNLEEDCLELDSECVRLADSLWRAIRVPDLSEAFIEWAAAVLGRAFASSGSRPVTTAIGGQKRLNEVSTQFEGVAKSQATIARSLSDMLLSRSRADASLADYTLRNVLISFQNEEEGLAFKGMLPHSLDPAILSGTQGYAPFQTSNIILEGVKIHDLQFALEPSPTTTLEGWAQDVSFILCRRASDTAIFPALTVALKNSYRLALDLLPCIVHILLVKELESEPILQMELSKSVTAHFAASSDIFHEKQQYLVELLLYLREQVRPGEQTQADRLRWLEVDWLVASDAAIRCGMPTASLLFAESASSTYASQGSRRSSTRASLSQVSISQIPQELLLSIYRTVEEPDSFYGVDQPASLDSVLGRLDYEADGYRSLMFRSAQTDTNLRHTHQLAQTDCGGIISSLSMLNLNSLTFALLSGGFGPVDSNEELLKTARRLQQWDIVPSAKSSGVASNSFAAFQELSRAHERSSMQCRLRSIMLEHVRPITRQDSRPSYEWFTALSSLSEMSEIINSIGPRAVRSIWTRMQERQSWMSMGRYDSFHLILSSRHTLFSVLAQNKALSNDMGISAKEWRSIEVESLLSASRFARKHGRLQEALTAANQCSDIIRDSRETIIKADVAAKLETASVLWDLGEVTASVNMLRDAHELSGEGRQDIPVGNSGLLAQLAHQNAEARLERPDEVLSKYLKPAIAQLQGREEGKEAGQVFHEFATFCDKQLQNPSSTEDFNRITKLRERKLREVEELDRLSRNAKKSGTEEEHYKARKKAQQWFKIDDTEYKRLKLDRDVFMEQSLQNYLRALHASNEHDISILRFFALWLENSDVEVANATVSKYLPGVPSWKFVVLMNQLMSRLEQDSTPFQAALKALAMRVCSEHPHHSLHHLFASTKKPSSQDLAGMSRFNVANDIRKYLRNDSKQQELLDNVYKSNGYYQDLAVAKTEGIRQNSKIAVKDLPAAYTVVKAIPGLCVPPPTINIQLQPDCNYDNVPVVTKISSTMQIMTGKSAPKKLVAYASNGKQYAQLFKGEDDLRQDAIMEQVFGEVSKMLQNHKSTRQRNLHVRTYKVIPLSPGSGIIEFVPHSMSFNDFLLPAHQSYHPQDMKINEARQRISAADKHSTETRVKEFQKICDRLHPVMRHFFFERFKDPDEWFEKRTAYTRTTATISILGYVLGLGDRHCQNIMLDEKTGEVVHIDLGVAFEAGRVLPVPELVPFRLSRDVVDGMGITKTEGVFRRCCEFTLDALREDKDSIMTLLNVLRYDPLYSWTISPLRAKRIQEQSAQNNGVGDALEGSSKKKEQEAGEADRALSIVEKKLSKTLSTAATVNELIQEATNIRNLATLFVGWSAYF